MRQTLNALPYRDRWWLIILCATGIAAYCLPWLVNRGTGLTFGAYDLAEWTSLHPAVRGGNPPLLASLLLRLPLACFGLVAAMTLWPNNKGKRLTLIFLVAIALLPPIEFFTQYRDDSNY